MRTVVSFRSSAFNTSETKSYFINPGCFGDDVAHSLIARLRAAGVSVDAEPEQEDFGWYFEFEVPEGRHCCVIGFRPGDEADDSDWILSLERSRGFLTSLVGARQRGIAPHAARHLHEALSRTPEVSMVRWFERQDFDAGREDASSPMP